MAFKLVHLLSVESIWFWNFSNFRLSYLGLSAHCIQTGPFAACWVNLVLKFFQLLTFILGAQCPLHSNWTICSLLSQLGYAGACGNHTWSHGLAMVSLEVRLGKVRLDYASLVQASLALTTRLWTEFYCMLLTNTSGGDWGILTSLSLRSMISIITFKTNSKSIQNDFKWILNVL